MRTIDSNAFKELLPFLQADFPLSSQLANNESFCPRSLVNPHTTDVACDVDGYIVEMSFVSNVSLFSKKTKYLFDLVTFLGLFSSTNQSIFKTSITIHSFTVKIGTAFVFLKRIL